MTAMHFRQCYVLMALVLLSAVAGCTVGPAGHRLGPAQTGQGITVEVTTRATSRYFELWNHSAEVLAVQTDGLLLRSHDASQRRIVRVAYSAIEEARFDDLSRLGFGWGAVPSAVQREELRLLSRFPQGVDDELLQRLLNVYDQDTLRTIP
jgi:hypothetical protein